MKNILVLSTYGAENPHGGGKYVLYHLFCRLSERFNITLLSLTEYDKTKNQIMIKSNFENINIPQDIQQAKIQWDMEKKYLEGLFDVVQINHWKNNIDYLDHVKKYINSSDIIILEHPYLVNLLDSVKTKIPIIYHAHNVEIIQKQSILKEELLCEVKNSEQKACDISSQIWVSSKEEQIIFKDKYHLDEKKLKILPHGVDLSYGKLIDRNTHDEIKSKLSNLNGKIVFVFTGSWHPPNLESVEFIISDLAHINKNYLFFIIGSVKDYYFHKYPNHTIPENVIFFGTITNEEKNSIYLMSDFAINPMFSGAGTNLKMLEYMASGLPVISTDFGARGIEISDKTLICKKENFTNYLKNVETTHYNNSSSIKENYNIIVDTYDYDVISKKCISFLLEILDPEITGLANIFGNVISELNNMGIHREDDSIINIISNEVQSINFNT